MNKLSQIQAKKQEYENLKEILTLVKFWTTPDVETIKHQNQKGKVKVLTRYPKPRY